MGTIKQVAQKYLSEGLSVIPTEGKVPCIPKEVSSRREWGEFSKRQPTSDEVETLFKDANEVAVVCGKVSGNLEVIDVDCKYDLTGSLWSELSLTIQDNLPGVWERLVVAETRSGGYHLYYRCDAIAGSRKLANRPVSEEERLVEPREKVKVLIESKGQGGYVLAEPSEGYRFIKGGTASIPTITTDERQVLLSIAGSFDEMPPVKATEQKDRRVAKARADGGRLSTFEDYNERGDGIGELLSAGWRIVYDGGERVMLLRPGHTASKSSGNYHRGFNRLYVWSTSTEFEAGEAYSNVDIYRTLRNLTLGEASKELYRAGYGDRYIPPTPSGQEAEFLIRQEEQINEESAAMSEKVRREAWDVQPKPIERLMDNIRNTPDALRLGYDELDKVVGASYGTVTLVGGRPGEGKTTFLFNTLLNMARLYPSKKFHFFSYEEPAANLLLKMLNSVIDKDLSSHYRMLKEMEGGEQSNYNFLRHYFRNDVYEVSDVTRGYEELSKHLSSNVYLYDNILTIEQLERKIRSLPGDGEVGGVFIDYAQRVPVDNKSDNLRERYMVVSETLKNTAKETGLPLIVGCQLNRSAKKETPGLEHLKESGNFEEDANTVILLWREEGDGVMRVSIPKNRDGKRVDAGLPLGFNGRTGKISNNRKSGLVF